jgi:hypothetical protein
VTYAAIKLPRDSVTKKQIKEDAVRASELAPDSVDSSNIVDGEVGGPDIANGSVGSDDLTNDSVGPAAIANNSVGPDDLVDNSIGPADLANNSIGPADLASEQGAIGPTLTSCDGGANNWLIGGASPPGYWMDARRVVHLEGAVSCPGDASEGGAIFTMPSAYRPATQSLVARFGVLANNLTLAQVAVVSDPNAAVLVYDGPNSTTVDNFVGLDGITYRALGPAP